LPTAAEWQKAARGGASGKRYPWGTDTISHAQANYMAESTDFGDQSGGAGYHPAYHNGSPPFTAPVGTFPPNGYGLYDMAGNVWEWCWDWYASSYDPGSFGTDPRGPASGKDRVGYGGSWNFTAQASRVTGHHNTEPSSGLNCGLRLVRSAIP